MSQKTFRNYLDDEEAALAQGQPTQSTQQRPSTAKVAKHFPTATTTSTTTTTTSAPPSSTTSTPITSDTPNQPPTTTNTTTTPSQELQGLIPSEFDSNPLLRSYIPSAPSERIMQALLSEPPLSYNASRAKPPTVGASGKAPPPRQFCSICGYWGGIRCRKCHSRTCGLDCFKVHEETRCDRFYA
jgi:zinc finger HIT domain-containing protein 1